MNAAIHYLHLRQFDCRVKRLWANGDRIANAAESLPDAVQQRLAASERELPSGLRGLRGSLARWLGFKPQIGH